jgi:UDP-glucose 4-epimerase
MEILVTGGLGYIGSHTVVELLENNHDVVIYDDLSNSDLSVLDSISQITKRSVKFYEGDVRNKALLIEVLQKHSIDIVIHFAGLKSLTESAQNPLEYYDNNVFGTVSLLSAMRHSQARKIIFSSSASVYGNPKFVPIPEVHPLVPTNPYANTKKHVEEIMTDLVKSDERWKVICLRYFNPIGAHSSGLIGENPKGLPNNLVPYIARVASGENPVLPVYGENYPTPDGTGIRDYIHVVDLANGHIAALNFFSNQSENPAIFNLGRGEGVSVFEMIEAFEVASGVTINFEIKPPRSGDVAECYADNTKACNILNWHPQHDLSDMCTSAWLFTQMSK